MAERGTSYEGMPPPPSDEPSGERRVAIVIGNSAYPQAPLKNPRNDAESVAAKLKIVSPAFDVTVALDVGRDAMEDALERFEAKLGNCDTALLFFAGHGLQVKGINYLMPVDADIRQEIHLKRRAISLNEILDIMGRRVRQSSLVFLDACRDNPFARSLLAGLPDEARGRFLTRSGLAEVRAGAGSFVAFATAPDNVALDGSGRNSPFTEALLRHVETPGASINDVMIAVRRDVLKVTGGRQEPWDQSSLRERFCFHNVAQAPEVIAPSPPQPLYEAAPISEAALFEKAAIEHWETVKGTSDPARLREFVAEYGTSRMGKLAREALQRLATMVWRKVNKRDEAALAGFIADYPGTQEIAEAGALLAKAQAARETATLKAAERAEARAGTSASFPSRPLLIGAGLAAAAALFFVLSPRMEVETEPSVTGTQPSATGSKDSAPSEKKAQSTGQTATAALTPGRVFRDCPDCPEMVVVPAGSFMIGSPEGEEGRTSDEGPQRRVTIAQPFAAGRYEVTFDEWDACVAAGGCKHKPEDAGWGRGPRPVINVSWNDAKEYLDWLSKLTGKSYRLLTEAEWEHAARAGNPGKWSFGDNQAELGDYAWFSSNSERKTQLVGTKKPNAFGLHDVRGNVWEWVEDCVGDSYAKAPANGSKAPDRNGCYRVLRGGCWFSDPQDFRSAPRDWYPPDYRGILRGFRLARTLPPTL